MDRLEITVPGEPRPWRVYTKRGEQPLAHRQLQAYQETIRAAAWVAMAGREPLRVRVDLELMFYLVFPQGQPEPGESREDWLGRKLLEPPDLTNLQKAAEDALKGIVMEDDSQCFRVEAEKGFSAQPRTEALVWWEPDGPARKPARRGKRKAAR